MAEQITFDVTLVGGQLEFEFKGRSSPTWTSITKWNCEVVSAAFDLQINKELLIAIRELQKTFDDSLTVTLTHIWNKKENFIFEFGHDTRDDAVQLAEKFTDVKDTILKFIQKNDANIRDIRLWYSFEDLNGSSQPYNENTVTRRDRRSDSALLVASRAGDLSAVERILASGRVDVNCRDCFGATSVMAAAWCGRTEVVEFLVREGADVSMVDCDGKNTLHFACVGGYVKTVKLVLSQNKVNINSRGHKSRTPVMIAAWCVRRVVVEFLVSEGADVSLVDDDGNNTLHCACRGGDVETVKFVLSKHVLDIDARNTSGKTAADVAKLKGHKQVVRLLVSHCSDVKGV